MEEINIAVLKHNTLFVGSKPTQHITSNKDVTMYWKLSEHGEIQGIVIRTAVVSSEIKRSPTIRSSYEYVAVEKFAEVFVPIAEVMEVSCVTTEYRVATEAEYLEKNKESEDEEGN